MFRLRGTAGNTLKTNGAIVPPLEKANMTTRTVSE